MLSTLHQTPCVKDKSNQELRLYHVDTWQRHLGQGPKELQMIKAGLRRARVGIQRMANRSTAKPTTQAL
jgi:hypothetical protein